MQQSSVAFRTIKILIYPPFTCLKSEYIITSLRRAFLDIRFERGIFFKQILLQLFRIFFIQAIQSKTNINRLFTLKRRYNLTTYFVRYVIYDSFYMVVPASITYLIRSVMSCLITIIFIIAYLANLSFWKQRQDDFICIHVFQIIRLYVFVYIYDSLIKQVNRKMIDRLPQLKKSAALLGNTSEEDLDQQVNKNTGQNEEENELDEQFTEDIKSVRSMIAGLNANNKKIQVIKNNYAKAIKSAQQKQNSDEMNSILNENSVFQNKIKKKLVQIGQSVKLAEKNQPNQPETRMKKNFHLNLSKQVSDVLQRQQKFEEEFRDTVKQKVTRQVKLIDRDIDEQQLQEYINNPQKAQQMLEKKLWGQASITLKNTVCDIQDKLRDIEKLQASVTQCVQLFNQLSALVFAQGQKIDSIEANVVACKDYIQSADKKLQKPVQHHKCSRKCMCIALIIAAVVLVIIIIAVLATKA